MKTGNGIYVRGTPCAMQAQSWQTRSAPCLQTICGDPSLKGQAALCFRRKPLSFQFFDERRAVDLKQLSGFTGNPVSAAKRADDETMFELLELP